MKKMMKRLIGGLFLLFFVASAAASTFQLTPNQRLVGKIQTVAVGQGEDITTIGQKYDVGYYELLEANQGKNIDHLQVGEKLVIPSQYILPDAPQSGIVINLAEMRLYYYPNDKQEVITVSVTNQLAIPIFHANDI
ncbi:MAG: LysM peptidoglycan-binding domain-containing protein [Gammaproteobacteria bacterium]|nr:LysM peptidoglycan-binding domain-containing protein [Gammaproteobacteria bacterium]